MANPGIQLTEASLSATDLYHLLELRYPLPKWVLLREVREGTGYGVSQSADAAAWCCWPSIGDHRVAFEIKIARSDWLRELSRPAKRRWLEEWFHETYIVVPYGIVKDGEVPEGWGLLVATKKGDSLRCKIRPMHRAHEATPPIELAALRSIAEQMVSERSHHYRFNCQDISRADLDAKVNAILEVERLRLKDKATVLDRNKQLLEDQRDALISPLQDLARHAGDWWRGNGMKKTTDVPNVDELFLEMQRRALKGPILPALERSLNSLQQAIMMIRGKQESGETIE